MHSPPRPKSASQHLRNKSTASPDISRSDPLLPSLQRPWTDDYYVEDYARGQHENSLEDTSAVSAPPSPVSISLSTHEESPLTGLQPHHKQSLSGPLPSPSRINVQSPQRSLQSSPCHSPVKEKLDFGSMPTFTGDRAGVVKSLDKSRGGLSGWFSGSTTSPTLGIPVTELQATSATMPSYDSTPTRSPRLQKRPTLPTIDSSLPSIASTSRFNFFGPKTPVAKAGQIPAAMDDEFLSFDINSALFPRGSPSDRDPFSPSAFKNLLVNAEGLLLKLQTAYKIRTLSLREITAERDAQAEELEEAETRAKHLKLQLEDMGRKLEAQDAAVAELSSELVREKQARAAENEARETSTPLAKLGGEEMDLVSAPPPEEDLGIASAGKRKHKWRQSNGSTDFSAEGESDMDDDMSGRAESVFSRSRSPPMLDSSATSIMTMESTPELIQASFGRLPGQNPPTNRLKTTRQATTFQKILKGISGEPEIKEEIRGFGLEDSCSNCRGKDSSVAWDAVGLLRAENKGLKERVGELETAVDEAINISLGSDFRVKY